MKVWDDLRFLLVGLSLDDVDGGSYFRLKYMLWWFVYECSIRLFLGIVKCSIQLSLLCLNNNDH